MDKTKLLQQPVEERIKYFTEYMVAHPLLIETLREVEDTIAAVEKNSILLVYGPSGVGKSTLFMKLLEKTLTQNRERMEDDKGFIPILAVEAVPSYGNKHNWWRDFYTRCLMGLNEPLIDKKINYAENCDSNKTLIRQGDTTAGLLRSLEQAIKHRKPSVILIDEAQHITNVRASTEYRNQMDRLKSLSNKTRTPIVLFGTYDLLRFRGLSGQLIRRGENIEFARYSPKNQSHVKMFKDVLLTFQKIMPLPVEPKLIGNFEYFFERSIGCVGILKDWFTRTLKYHLNREPNLQTLELHHFEKYENSIIECRTLLEEIIDGEGDARKENKYEIFKREFYSNEIIREEEAEPEETERKTGNRKPGTRCPKRDAVG